MNKLCDERAFPKHFVYKYVDNETGEVIYIGKTNASLKARINIHKKDARFLSYIENSTIFCTQFSTSDDADAAELSLISELNPELNTVYPGYKPLASFKDKNIDWDLCEDVLKLGQSNCKRENVLKERAKMDMNLIELIIEAMCRDGCSKGDQILIPFAHPTGGVLCGDNFIQLISRENKKQDNLYLYTIEAPDDFGNMLHRIEYSVWLPVAQVHEFSEEEYEEFDSISRLFDFSYRLKRLSKEASEKGAIKILIGKEASMVVGAWEPIFKSIKWIENGVCEAEIVSKSIGRYDEIFEDIAAQGMGFLKRSGVLK